MLSLKDLIHQPSQDIKRVLKNIICDLVSKIILLRTIKLFAKDIIFNVGVLGNLRHVEMRRHRLAFDIMTANEDIGLLGGKSIPVSRQTCRPGFFVMTNTTMWAHRMIKMQRW